jgi:uncharacterized protein
VKVVQKFTVARPPDEVWAFFQDVPAVARCMPGAELLGDKGEGLYAGRVKVRLGPFGANFEGEAKVSADPASRSGHVEGKGVDKRGGSRTRMVMDYQLAPVGDGTEVTVDADVTLAGAIAQFGRTSLIQETANILVQDFVRALERELAAGTRDAALPDTTPRPSTDTAEKAAASPSASRPQGPQSAKTPASQAPELPHAPEAAEAGSPRQAAGPSRRPEPAATAKPQPASKAATSAKPVPREIRAGSVGLRALWAWFKSLLRGLFSSSGKDY